MQKLERQMGTLQADKNDYYLEVNQLKYRIFELDYHKVKKGDNNASAQLFKYEKSINGFDGYVHMSTLRVETEKTNL